MKRSTERILVTHQGTLPKPDDLREMIAAKSQGRPYDKEALAARTRAAVADAVRRQAECGIDCVNDGEMSKTTFSDYVSDRLGGLEPTAEQYVSPISGRDIREFPEYFAAQGTLGRATREVGVRRVVHSCTGPLTYTGQDAVRADIENFKA